MTAHEAAEAAIKSIIAERGRQDAKWGEQNHDPFTYLTILMEEVGEFAQAALQTRFKGEKGGWEAMHNEAVQMAAVAMAIVECLERKKWEWPISSKVKSRKGDRDVPERNTDR